MRELQIIVCMKQVPDPEGPANAFKVDAEARKVIPVGIPPVINPFDENALEVGLRIKDIYAAKVRAISMGVQLARPVLTKALAVGADDLILLEDPLFKDLDSFSAAYVLASIINKIEVYDLILTGRQAGDWDFGVTGLLIAEILQIPCINLAQKVKIKDDNILVEILTPDGYEVVKAPMPAVVTVSSEAGELRPITSLRVLLTATKRPIEVYNAKDLDLDTQKVGSRQIFELVSTNIKRQCKMIEGESSQEKGENLAIWMKKEALL